jgi:hypothetical protein
MGEQQYNFSASSDSVSVFSLTLIRQPGASSEFLPVALQLETELSATEKVILDTFFYVRAPAIHSFSVSVAQPDIEVPPNAKEVVVPLLVKNKGTTTGQYQISFKASFYDEPVRFELRLRPGADSLFNCSLVLPVGIASNTPRLVASISDSTGMIQSLPLTISSPRSGGKAHASPFADFPAELESGLMLVDRQVSYFGAARASWTSRVGSVDFSFRSKLYGPLNTLERNVFTAQLVRKRWDLSVGQLNSTQHFFSYGRGFSVLYRLSPTYQLGAQTIFHAVPGTFTNNTYSVWLQRRLASSLSIFRAVANRDVKKGLHEYVVNYERGWQPTKQMHVKINVALGWEKFLRVPVSSSGALALGGGYNLQQNGKKMEWTSSWQRFPALFPGVDKGLHTHMHQIRWLRRKGYVDVFYSYNSVVSTLLTDTIYLTDVFRFNSEKSGVRVGYRKNLIDLSVSSGWLRQTGVSTALLPSYRYGELFFSSASASGHSFSVKSLFGYANDRLITRPVFINNTTVSYRHKSSGIRAFYLQQPTLKDSVVKVVTRINQTLSVSPYAGFRLWKRVALQLRYNVSKTRFDERINTSAGVAASWQQPNRGWNLSFAGTFPFSRSAAPGILGTSIPFFNLSVKKSLRIPFPIKRRYYQLVVTTYADLNSNKRFDSLDQLLSGVGVRIGKENFVTGKDGAFSWKNIDTGLYRISLSGTTAYRGLVPPADHELTTHVNCSQKIMIPFSKSCVISGRISVELDSYSTLSIEPDHIKVKAVDSTGNEYSALTNENGEYFINVPAGHYTVSLNPEAFTGSIRPTVLFSAVDLRARQDAVVNFTLQERKRPMRLLKQ